MSDADAGRAPGKGHAVAPSLPSQAVPHPLGGSSDVPAGRGAPLRPRGSNHVGMRQFNERVVLQAIRLNGSLPKAAIARMTRLTAQTVQVIIARLEADALVTKLEPVRGKVGQPSVPMALNPDGAFSIGIKIGRRSMDMLLLDFTGAVRERLSLAYVFPDPDTLFPEIEARLQQLTQSLPFKLRSRLHGVGIAAPLSLEYSDYTEYVPFPAARDCGLAVSRDHDRARRPDLAPRHPLATCRPARTRRSECRRADTSSRRCAAISA